MSDCLFCKIAAGEIPSKKVYEDDDFLAFHDINPKAPTHVLVIPRDHYETFADLDDPFMHGMLMDRVRQIAEDLGLDAGYRLVINVKEGGGQEVFHLHVHILGGKKLPF